MHACVCVSVCIYVCLSLLLCFLFFSFVYFVRNVLSRLLRHLLAPIGAVLNLPRGLSARSSLQIRTRYVPGVWERKPHP